MTTEHNSDSSSSVMDNSQDNDQSTDSVNTGAGNEGDTVRYGTYKKVLNEAKNLRSKHSEAIAELAVYQSKEKESAEKLLIEEKKFDEVLRAKEVEIEETRNLLNQSTKQMTDYQKMTGFLQSLGSAKLESDYFQLVELDRIKLDDEGSLDQASLSEYANEFKTRHQRLLITPKSDLPANYTGGSGGGGLNYKDWQNLKSAKEKREQWKNIDPTTMP